MRRSIGISRNHLLRLEKHFSNVASSFDKDVNLAIPPKSSLFIL